MQSRAALIFVLSFLTFLRAASAHSWASAGAALTVHALAVAIVLAAALAGAWVAYQVVHRQATVRPRAGHRHGHLLIAR